MSGWSIKKNHPLNHTVAYYDEIHLRTVSMVVEDGVVIDQGHQWLLPCPWEAGQCQAKGRMYIWNLMEPDFCQVAVLKKFLGHRLQANISDPDAPQGQHQVEAIARSGSDQWDRSASADRS